jgi:hypothetical protein
MSDIPDFNTNELEVIHATLKQRYGQEIAVQLADSELRLDPSTPQLTLCPTVYWEMDKIGFVIFKTALARYRCQFFYSQLEQYGTGLQEYHNILECITTLLQVQADHALDRKLYG